MQKYRFINENREHLHQLFDGNDWKPLRGTSTIINVLNVPLAYYGSGMAVQQFGVPDYHIYGKRCKGEATEAEEVNLELSANAKLKELREMNIADYLKLLESAYRAHDKDKNEKADKGTDRHALLEAFGLSEMGKVKRPDSDFMEIAQYVSWSRANIKRYIAAEAHCYSVAEWCGGIIDAVVELNDGNYAVVDYKSSPVAYPKQFIQTALYAIQTDENGLFNAEGTANKKLDKPITALIIVPFGAKVVTPVIKYDVENYKRGALCVSALDRIINNQ